MYMLRPIDRSMHGWYHSQFGIEKLSKRFRDRATLLFFIANMTYLSSQGDKSELEIKADPPCWIRCTR